LTLNVCPQGVYFRAYLVIRRLEATQSQLGRSVVISQRAFDRPLFVPALEGRYPSGQHDSIAGSFEPPAGIDAPVSFINSCWK